MNSLAGVAQALQSGRGVVEVPAELIERARRPIERMLAFTAAQRAGHDAGALVPHLGAA